MVVGDGAFTRQQLSVLSQLIEATVNERLQETDPRGLIPATVNAYDPNTRYTVVTIDGDSGTTPRVFNKEWAQLQPGDRVLVEFLPGGSAFIDGAIRTTDILCGCVLRSSPTVNIPDSTLTDLKNLTEQFDPFGIYDPATGKLTIPDGGAGLWAVSLVGNNFGSGFTRAFVEFELDGFHYRGANYFSGTAAEPVDHASGVVFLSPGDEIDLRLFHMGTGSAQDFFVRVDAWKVQPGRLT